MTKGAKTPNRKLWLSVWCIVLAGVVLFNTWATNYAMSWDIVLTTYFGIIEDKKEETAAPAVVETEKYATLEELREAEKELALEVAAEGMVLLKNDNSALPLAKGSKVSVFGQTAQMWMTKEKLPNTKGHTLVSAQSSMFLSKPCNVSDYGMIYAGVQKNVGPAGMVVVIIREDLIREDIDPKMPVYMSYKTHADNGSMYNTPNCWAIYCCGKVFKYLKSIGGLEVMHQRNIEKAKVIYDFLDSSKMFHGTVEPEFRSLMNIPFVTDSAELDAEVVAATKAAGFDNLKGHKSVGGLRASIYNAMPKEGVEALVRFLSEFEANYKK